MIIYAALVMALHLVAMGTALDRKDKQLTVGSIFGIALMLPLYGRILGWW